MTTAVQETTGRRKASKAPKVTDSRTTSRGPGGTPAKTRRRPALIGLGIALAILGGLTSWYLASQAGHTVAVLETKTDIARGTTISATDLTTLEVAGGQNVSAFTADQAKQVIGQVATVDLPTGSLVTKSNVGEGLAITAGKSIVGVALGAAQMPTYPLAAGDTIRIVDTPVAQGEPPATTPQAFKATVFTTKYVEKTNQWIVDLIVPTGQAADIAARAATGRIALVVDADGGK